MQLGVLNSALFLRCKTSKGDVETIKSGSGPKPRDKAKDQIQHRWRGDEKVWKNLQEEGWWSREQTRSGRVLVQSHHRVFERNLSVQCKNNICCFIFQKIYLYAAAQCVEQ